MPQRKLRGALPTSRARLAAATPHVPTAEVIPGQFVVVPKQLNMWGNATFGDCVTAEEAFAKACHSPEVFIPARKVIRWARRNWVLNGAGLWEVMTLMQTGGFDQDGMTYNDGPFRSVDWTVAATLQDAIYQGPVKLGVSGDPLENVPGCGDANGWFATGLVGGAQDHCVSLCGYGTFGWLAEELAVTLPHDIEADTPGYALFTWSTIGIIDEPSLAAITGEAWLRTPTTVEVKDA